MQGVQGFDLLSILLAAEPIIVLNAAFCQLHRRRCPPSEQLLRECAYVSASAPILHYLYCSCIHAHADPSRSTHGSPSHSLCSEGILRKECGNHVQAEQMERDFDAMTNALQQNLTSVSCINKDVRHHIAMPSAC
jgi:hypothetical protein